MKIFWIAHEGNKSGANNMLLDYAALLNKRAYDITVIVPAKGNMIDECIKRNLRTKHFYYASMVHVQPIGIAQWIKRRLRNYLLFFEVLFYFIKEKPQIVITNSIVTTPMFAIAAKLLFKKHIWFIQEFGDKDHGLKFDLGYGAAVKIISFFSDTIIVVAGAIKTHMEKYIDTSGIITIFNRIKLDAAIGNGDKV